MKCSSFCDSFEAEKLTLGYGLQIGAQKETERDSSITAAEQSFERRLKAWSKNAAINARSTSRRFTHVQPAAIAEAVLLMTSHYPMETSYV